MQLKGARILLTGATGGLGQALARQLAEAGAALFLVGREGDRLATLEKSLAPACPAGIRSQACDLADPAAIARVAAAAREFGANCLINNAGIGSFGLFARQPAGEIEAVLAINLVAPIQLTRLVLPDLLERPEAAVVNVGSAFGSVPFAGFAAYSASKAGLKGFSQALRRELADTPVRVIHVAPRAIDTALNSPAVQRLNHALGNASDLPEAVAQRIVAALEREAPETHIGFPERLFARLNGLLPGLVDRGVRGKLATIKRHALTP